VVQLPTGTWLPSMNPGQLIWQLYVFVGVEDLDLRSGAFLTYGSEIRDG
jgi:hypothetical protein